MKTAKKDPAPELDRTMLERLYARFNDRRYVSTDPVELVHRYRDPRDREIAALVASSLAFGNVKQIRASAARALGRLGDAPADFLAGSSNGDLERALAGFKHRWITGVELASMLRGAKSALLEYGSLRELFYSKLASTDPDVAPSAARFVEYIRRRSDGFRSCLLPSTESGSACKRMNLFLRWMVRSDAIDPGGWDEIPASMLLVPLDVHMHGMATRFGLTKRAAADLKTAREVTAAFRWVAPEDPVKYDFALTRLGVLRGALGFGKERGEPAAGIEAKEVRCARGRL